MGRYFENVDSSVKGCNSIRLQICAFLKEPLDGGDIILAETMKAHREDQGTYDDDISLMENAEAEIEHLPQPTTWCGYECLDAFTKIYGVRVKLTVGRI